MELGGVKASPHADLIYKGIDFAKKEKVDFILAVGGGSVMDSAKGIALGVPYDGDFWDFYCGKKGPVTEALPVGCVVTIAASGSKDPRIPWSPLIRKMVMNTNAALTAISCVRSLPS